MTQAYNMMLLITTLMCMDEGCLIGSFFWVKLGSRTLKYMGPHPPALFIGLGSYGCPALKGLGCIGCIGVCPGMGE